MLSVALSVLNIINIVICVLFVFCYAYQFVYIPIALFARRRPHKPVVIHEFAVLVAAHNEEAVLGQLLASLYAQDYPKEHFRVFVIADNCNDGTVRVAREAGATVYERHDTEHIGKGYALNYLLGALDRDFGKGAFDAYIVFDADNLADRRFITEINKTYSDGYEIVTAYRNSKNYGDTWISAGSGMWFIRDSRYLNGARFALGSSAVLAGTGFLFSDKIKEECGGWPFHCLTEDTEFMVHNVLQGHTVGYAADAMFYDEQPTGFVSSWNQRIRWAKGGLQVFAKYFGGLVRGLFTKMSFTCYDFLMSVAPAYVLSIAAVFVNVARIVLSIVAGNGVEALVTAAQMIGGMYGMLFVFSVLATITEWKKIRCTPGKKILYLFTFPLFMLTYIPIAFFALFIKVKWKTIPHTKAKTIEEMEQGSVVKEEIPAESAAEEDTHTADVRIREAANNY